MKSLQAQLIFRLLIAASMWLMVSVSVSAKTSLDRYKELSEKGEGLLVTNRNEEAKAVFTQAVEAASKIRDSKEELANALFKLAACCENLADKKAALSNYKQALAIAQDCNSVQESDLTLLRNKIARLYAASGDKKGMVKTLDASLAKLISYQQLTMKAVHSDSRVRKAAMDTIALYNKYKLYDDIVSLCKKMLAGIERDDFGTFDVDIYRFAMANAYFDSGNMSEAETQYKLLLMHRGPIAQEQNSSPSSKTVREKLIQIFVKSGRASEAKHLETVAKNVADGKRFEYDPVNKLTKQAHEEFQRQEYDKALKTVQEAETLLASYHDFPGSTNIWLLDRSAEIYRIQKKYDKSESCYKRALEIVAMGVKGGALSKKNYMEIEPLKGYVKLLEEQNRTQEAAEFKAKIENMETARRKPSDPDPYFRKEEITGPVKLSIVHPGRPIFCGSENKFEMNVTNAAYYKPVWKIENFFGIDVSEDRKYGELRPGLKWTGKSSVSGYPGNINKCTYIAPHSAPDSPLFLHVQILRKSDDSEIASGKVPLSILEPEIAITPQKASLKFGEKIQINAKATNVAPNLVFEWHTSGGKLDADDPQYNKDNTVTMTGTYEAPGEGMVFSPEVVLSAQIRAPHAYEPIKKKEVKLSLPEFKREYRLK